MHEHALDGDLVGPVPSTSSIPRHGSRAAAGPDRRSPARMQPLATCISPRSEQSTMPNPVRSDPGSRPSIRDRGKQEKPMRPALRSASDQMSARSDLRIGAPAYDSVTGPPSCRNALPLSPSTTPPPAATDHGLDDLVAALQTLEIPASSLNVPARPARWCRNLPGTMRWPRPRCCISPAAEWIRCRLCPAAFEPAWARKPFALPTALPASANSISMNTGPPASRSPAARPKPCARCCLQWSAIRDWCWRDWQSRRCGPGMRASFDARERARLALEIQELFAPLANRLGVWQLKWELEDLAFRALEPADVQVDRQAPRRAPARPRALHRRRIVETSRSELARGRHRGRGHGTAEAHLQHLAEDAAQAASLRAALRHPRRAHPRRLGGGLLHRARRRPPPLDAARGRIRRLHRQAEGQQLPVAAHGRGRPGRPAARGADPHARNAPAFRATASPRTGATRKAATRRRPPDVRPEDRVAAPGARLEGSGRRLGEWVHASDLFTDAIYVMTPQGKVIDLPRGLHAGRLRVHGHTELGHRCRGAKVDGQMVPLNYRLASGERVEIVTGKQGGPSRDWLNAELGYLATATAPAPKSASGSRRSSTRRRSRRAVRWSSASSRASARPRSPRTSSRVGLSSAGAPFRPDSGGTEPGPPVRSRALHRPNPLPDLPASNQACESPRSGRSPGRQVDGVGDLPTTLARCCAPGASAIHPRLPHAGARQSPSIARTAPALRTCCGRNRNGNCRWNGRNATMCGCPRECRSRPSTGADCCAISLTSSPRSISSIEGVTSHTDPDATGSRPLK